MTKNNTAYNTGFASGGVTCKLEALCCYSSSVLVDSFVLRNPPLRQAPNRYSRTCHSVVRRRRQVLNRQN
jgi:hypothetical protein